MKVFLFISVFLLATVVSFGQTRKIDSLKQRVNTAKTNKDKLYAILNLCNEYETLPKDTLWNYAIKAKAIAAAIKDTRAYSLAIVAQANAYIRWDNIDSAKALIEPELLKYKAGEPRTSNIYFKLEQAKIDCIGGSYDYKDAFSEVYNVIRQAEKYKDSVVMAESMNTLGAWNYDMDFLPQSFNLYYKALSYTSNNPRFYAVAATIYLNLASNYTWTGKQDSASYCINRAIVLSERIENLFYLSVALQKMAAIYIEKKQYAKAEQAILKSLQITGKIEGGAPQQDKLLVLASVYEHSGQIDKAIDVLNNGLALDSTFKNHSPHSKKGSEEKNLQTVFYYQELAKCYRIKGDSKKYEATLERIIAGKDAFYKANSAEAIAELETKYEVQKKETTIAQQKLALIKEKYFFNGSLAFVLLAAIIVWLVFKDLRRKQKLKLVKLHEEEQRLAQKAVADAEESERRRIAADLHDNLGAQLSFIKRNVNFIMDQPEGFSVEDERKYLGYVNDIAQNAMVDLRETIWVLNKDEVTIQEFADKLKSYLRQQLLDKEMISWDFQEDVGQSWKLSSGEVMHLFRIVQELVSNIIKHSGASHIIIKFRSDAPNTYRLELTDNGKGFDIDGKYEGHYGLENIQQRAKEINASLTLKSDAGNGTQVLLVKAQNNPYGVYNKPPVNTNFSK